METAWGRQPARCHRKSGDGRPLASLDGASEASIRGLGVEDLVAEPVELNDQPAMGGEGGGLIVAICPVADAETGPKPPRVGQDVTWRPKRANAGGNGGVGGGADSACSPDLEVAVGHHHAKVRGDEAEVAKEDLPSHQSERNGADVEVGEAAAGKDLARVRVIRLSRRRWERGRREAG